MQNLMLIFHFRLCKFLGGKATEQKHGLDEYQMAMAAIICEAIRIKRAEHHQEIKRGVDGEEKVGRLDVRTAIYAMGGTENTSPETRQILGKIRPLPELFRSEQTECWMAINKMIDEEDPSRKQLVNGEDEDDYEGRGWIKIFPESDFGKYISRLLLEEDI